MFTRTENFIFLLFKAQSYVAVQIKYGKAMVCIVVDRCGLTTQTMKYVVLTLKKSFQKIPSAVTQPTTNARRYVATVKSATNSRIT